MAACTQSTILRIDSDPPGADINITNLGFMGATPQEKSFTNAEIKKLGGSAPGLFQWVARDPGSFGVTISKRGYLDTVQTINMEYGERMSIRLELVARLEATEITSDPAGASVFHMRLSPSAGAATRTSFASNALAALGTAAPGEIELIFLGITPHNLRYNPAQPIMTGDFILFQKERYKDAVSVYNATQARLHAVMQPGTP